MVLGFSIIEFDAYFMFKFFVLRCISTMEIALSQTVKMFETFMIFIRADVLVTIEGKSAIAK